MPIIFVSIYARPITYIIKVYGRVYVTIHVRLCLFVSLKASRFFSLREISYIVKVQILQ